MITTQSMARDLRHEVVPRNSRTSYRDAGAAKYDDSIRPSDLSPKIVHGLCYFFWHIHIFWSFGFSVHVCVTPSLRLCEAQ